MPSLLTRSLLLLLLALCLVLGGCRRQVVAPGDPVAAVKGMAAAVRANDLVRYSRLSVPPDLHKRMETRWSERLKTAPPATAAQQRDYARWIGRLAAPDAEARLYKTFDARMRKLEGEIGSQWPLMQATGGIFLNGLVQADNRLSPDQKAHVKAVGSALLDWISPELLADRAKARRAIAVLSRTARALGLPTLAETRQLEMIPTLDKAGRALDGMKEVGRIYGVDVDQSLAALDARLESADAARATVRVSYPLLGKTIRFDMQLVRRDGRWYSADAVRKAEADLVKPLTAGLAAP